MTVWITPRLGTCAYDQRPETGFYLVDVRHLVDKGGNASVAIRKCIEAGVAALKSGQVVLVACDFGVSRSNSIAAGILSVAEGCSFDEAIARVLGATGEAEIKLDMIESVRSSLSNRDAYSPTGAVLITGGSGFIGSRLVQRLRESKRVLAPTRNVLNLEKGAVTFAAYCKSEGVSQIVHLAYPRVYTNANSMSGGISMLRTVLDSCKSLDIRLVFVSGTVIYGGYKTQRLIADETLPFRPKGSYGDAKFLEEMLVNAYSARGDVRRSICRLASVYGPGGDRPRLINNFREHVLSDSNIHTHLYRNGRPALDLLYIDDAVEAIARITETHTDETLHFGSGTMHTTIEIAELIANKLGRRLRADELLIEDDIANIQMDASKARDRLGWFATVPLEQGISNCVRFAGEARVEPS